MKFINRIHPFWVAATISLGVILWLAGGAFGKSAVGGSVDQKSNDANESTPERKKISVRITHSQAKLLTRESITSARLAASRRIQLRAEIAGKVEQTGAERGERVAAGDVIAVLAINDRKAQLQKAEAQLKQRKIQYSAAKKLHREGHQTDVELAQAQANLAVAEAEVKSQKQALGNTVIRAPFAGVLERRPVEAGNYVRAGDEIGWIIQTDPFLVRGNVSENVISYLRAGQPGKARLTDGTMIEGQLQYVASESDEATRTFPVELKIPNPADAQQRLVAGTSALLLLPLEEVVAHEIEPATLTLSKDGRFGVKAVNQQGQVEFHEAEIAQNRRGKVWLTGLPASLRIITVGQGFVSSGDEVNVVSESVNAAEPRQDSSS